MYIKDIIKEESENRLKKELIGKKISIDSFNFAYLNENGKYEIVDVDLQIEEKTFYDDGCDYQYIEFDYFDITLELTAETLKARRKRYPRMRADQHVKG
jgi:hypothetical protein